MNRSYYHDFKLIECEPILSSYFTSYDHDYAFISFQESLIIEDLRSLKVTKYPWGRLRILRGDLGPLYIYEGCNDDRSGPPLYTPMDSVLMMGGHLPTLHYL